LNPARTATQRGTVDQSEATPLSLPTPALPKGGGAIRGIGERASVNPARGTFSFQVPVATSAGRSGFGPRHLAGQILGVRGRAGLGANTTDARQQPRSRQ
jgi:hypothetical protein